MNDIQSFIQNARDKKLTDDEIIELLVGNGWSSSKAKAAVLGIDVPAATQEAPVVETRASLENSSSAAKIDEVPSIGALEAALQHVLLWLFTSVSTIMISVVSVALFNSPSSESLLTYLVLEAVTFIPFAALFIYYLRKLHGTLELRTGKVWSIITIVIHSIGLISALISLILVIVLVDSGEGKTAGVLAGTAVAVMNASVVVAYVVANFVKSRYTLRKRVLIAFPVILLIVIASFGIAALLRVGPLKADDQTRQDLVTTVDAIREYTKKNNRLPQSLSQTSAAAKGIRYTKKTNTTYSLCATFKRGGDQSGYYANRDTIGDEYVSESNFSANEKGEDCFTLESRVMLDEPYNRRIQLDRNNDIYDYNYNYDDQDTEDNVYSN